MLFLRAILNESGTHLAVAEPTGSDWRASFDHFLTDNETIDRRTASTAKFFWPDHAEVPLGCKFARKLLGVSVHPCDVVASVFAYAFGCKFGCLPAQLNLFGGPYEIHISTDGRGRTGALRYCVQVKYK